MMKSRKHLFKAPGKPDRSAFTKTTRNRCPNCGRTKLAVYFRSGRSRVGAHCYSCGMTGFFARDNFFEIGRIAPHLYAHKARSRLAGG